ncbi:BsuPI-related putative proteinase inhibitor [Mesobacillus harenae]|uniref:BsuPI-related putative proteinase inhibitor n=1 Tax=Mesobacillus harenae TaxID=2213203 RepID=UPI001580AA61|nr:BsuPI-related putative proteinase inhibitor [Mesobacillus harenae]
MATKKMFYMMSSFLLIGLLAGCGGSNPNVSPQEASAETPQKEELATIFHTTIETKEDNGVTVITYKVKNTSGEIQELTFSNGLQADYILYDEAGNKVKQFSDEVLSKQAIQELKIEVDEELQNEFRINDLPNGRYVIEVFLTANKEDTRVLMDIIIENSQVSKGTGLLVGQMDPHTVEISMDHTKSAFQLSDEAIQQVQSLHDGEAVTFIFTENGQQKTIEKFLDEEGK